MKKILFAAVAALAITGCSQNEEIEKAAKTAEIGFNSVVSKTTRATSVNLDVLKTNGFTVYAYNTGNDAIGTGALAKNIIVKSLLLGIVQTSGMGVKPIIGLTVVKYNFLHILQRMLQG